MAAKPVKKQATKKGDKKFRYNRIKIVLVEQERTSLWLAGQMGVIPLTVSRWCTNDAQPSLPDLFRIAGLLGVHVPDLINSADGF